MARLIFVVLVFAMVVILLLLLASALLGLGWVVSQAFGFAQITPYQATIVLMFVVGVLSFWLTRSIRLPISAEEDYWEEEEADEEEQESPHERILNAVASSSRQRSFDRSPTSGPDEPRRNDPCPCGSGKKYRHCCGRRTT